MDLFKDGRASRLTIAVTLLLAGCSPSLEDLAEMVNRDCPGSMSVKCIAAQAELSVNELQGKLDAAMTANFRERFVADHGKDAYRQFVLALQQELFTAELLTISRWTVFFSPDARFSQKYLKYAAPDLANERSKEMARETIALTKEVNEALAGMPEQGQPADYARMDASELGAGTGAGPNDSAQTAEASALSATPSDTPETGADTGPSFDCAKASTHTEKLICSDSELAALDRRLSKVYADLRSDQESGDYFRSDQREWLQKTRATCSDVNCLAAVYSQRLEEMETARQYLSKPAEFR